MKRFALQLFKQSRQRRQKGSCAEDDFRKENKKTEESIAGLLGKFAKLEPIYDAIDVENKENILAIPLMRKDVSQISVDLKSLQSTVEQEHFDTSNRNRKRNRKDL